MGSLWLSLTILATLAAEPARSPAPGALPLTLTLHLRDPEGAGPFALEGVQAEVQRLFAPLGVRVATGGDADGAIQVILLGADRSGGGLHGETAAGSISPLRGRKISVAAAAAPATIRIARGNRIRRSLIDSTL